MKRFVTLLLALTLAIHPLPVFGWGENGGSVDTSNNSNSSDDYYEPPSYSDQPVIPDVRPEPIEREATEDEEESGSSSGGGGGGSGDDGYYVPSVVPVEIINIPLPVDVVSMPEITPRVGQLISVNNLVQEVIWKPSLDEIKDSLVNYVQTLGLYKGLNVSSFDVIRHAVKDPDIYKGFETNSEVMATLGRDIYIMHDYISNGSGALKESDAILFMGNNWDMPVNTREGYHAVLPKQDEITFENFNMFMLKAMEKHEITFDVFTNSLLVHYEKENVASQMSVEGIDNKYTEMETESVHVFTSRSNAMAYRQAFYKYFPNGVASLNKVMSVDVDQSPYKDSDWQRRLTYADFFQLVHTYLHTLSNEPVYTEQEIATLIKLYAKDLPHALTNSTKMKILDLYARGIVAPDSRIVLSNYVDLDTAMDIIMRASRKDKRYDLKNIQITLDWKEVSSFADQSVDNVITSFRSSDMIYETSGFNLNSIGTEIPNIRVESDFDTYYIKLPESYLFKDENGNSIPYLGDNVGLLTGTNSYTPASLIPNGSRGEMVTNPVTGERYFKLEIYKEDYLREDENSNVRGFNLDEYWADALSNEYMREASVRLRDYMPGLILNTAGGSDSPRWWYLEFGGGGYYEYVEHVDNDAPAFRKVDSLMNRGLSGYDETNSFYNSEKESSNPSTGRKQETYFGELSTFTKDTRMFYSSGSNILDLVNRVFFQTYNNTTDEHEVWIDANVPAQSQEIARIRTSVFTAMLNVFKPLTVFANAIGPSKNTIGSIATPSQALQRLQANISNRASDSSTANVNAIGQRLEQKVSSLITDSNVLHSFISDDKYIRLADLLNSTNTIDPYSNPTIQWISGSNPLLGSGFILTLKDAQGNETRITQTANKQTISYNTMIIDYTDVQNPKKLLHYNSNAIPEEWFNVQTQVLSSERDLNNLFIHMDVIYGRSGSMSGESNDVKGGSLRFNQLTNSGVTTDSMYLYVPEEMTKVNLRNYLNTNDISLSAVWAQDGVIIPFNQAKNYLANYTVLIAKNKAKDKLIVGYPFGTVPGYNYNDAITSLEEIGVAGLIFENAEQNNYDYKITDLYMKPGMLGNDYGFKHGLGYFMVIKNEDMRTPIAQQITNLTRQDIGRRILDYGAYTNGSNLELGILMQNDETSTQGFSSGTFRAYTQVRPTFIGLTQFLTGYDTYSGTLDSIKTGFRFIGAALMTTGTMGDQRLVNREGKELYYNVETTDKIYRLKDDVYSLSPTSRHDVRIVDSNASNNTGILYQIERFGMEGEDNTVSQFLQRVRNAEIDSIMSLIVMMLAVIYLFVPYLLVGASIVLLCLAIIKNGSKLTTMLLEKFDIIYYLAFKTKRHHEFTILDGFKMAVFYVFFAFMIQSRVIEALIVNCLEVLERFI